MKLVLKMNFEHKLAVCFFLFFIPGIPMALVRILTSDVSYVKGIPVRGNARFALALFLLFLSYVIIIGFLDILRKYIEKSRIRIMLSAFAKVSLYGYLIAFGHLMIYKNIVSIGLLVFSYMLIYYDFFKCELLETK